MNKQTTPWTLVRDICAICVVAVFLLPLAWTALDSVKPGSALFNKDGIVLLDFVPTFANYATIFSAGAFDSRWSILDTITVSVGATILGLVIALPAAFAIWRFESRRRTATRLLLACWMVPPIVLILPLFNLYHAAGLFDTRTGLILADAAIHLPFAILVLKSFFADLPPEVAEAATLDGASQWQIFAKIAAPMIGGGIAATAAIFFIFCWTEFFLALFLTSFLRLVPIQVSNMSNALGGSTFALSTAALVPGFLFLLLAHKHLARGFSLGFQRG